MRGVKGPAAQRASAAVGAVWRPSARAQAGDDPARSGWELIEPNYDMLVKYATAIMVGTAVQRSDPAALTPAKVHRDWVNVGVK